MAAPNISELIAKKNYAKAIEAIKAQLKAGKHNPQLHIQLADVLVLAKKPNEAIQILMRVADEFAHDGFEAKAIAVLKRVEKLEPGRRDVQMKLASLVKKPAAPTIPVSRGGGPELELGMEEIGFEPSGGSGGGISVPAAPISRAPEPPPPPPRPRAPEPELPSFMPAASEPAFDLGLDAGPALDLGLDARAPAPAPPKPKAPPKPPPPPPKPAPAPVQDLDFGLDDAAEEENLEEAPAIILEPEPEPEIVPEEDAAVEIADIQLEPDTTEDAAADAAGGADSGAFDDLFAQELMGAIDDAFSGGVEASAEPEQARPTVVGGDVMSNPLFAGFAPDELVAILQGLNLHTFEPGDIIISQGDPGNSLFILTTGTVKAFVNNKFVKDLEEGSFFGEVAILTGQPRTATITAKTPCELLELDRGTLDAISISHPHVQQVLQEFYEQRMKGK
jgi:hypothetical protein